MAGTSEGIETDSVDVQSPLRLSTVELSDGGMTELTPDGFRAVFLPRSCIRRITPVYGCASERPILGLCAALVCLGFGGAASLSALGALSNPLIRLRLGLIVAALFTLPMGVWLLWTVIRRSYYVRVTTDREVRKLRLHGATDPSLLERFLADARHRFGYEIDTQLIDRRARLIVNRRRDSPARRQ